MENAGKFSITLKGSEIVKVGDQPVAIIFKTKTSDKETGITHKAVESLASHSFDVTKTETTVLGMGTAKGVTVSTDSSVMAVGVTLNPDTPVGNKLRFGGTAKAADFSLTMYGEVGGIQAYHRTEKQVIQAVDAIHVDSAEIVEGATKSSDWLDVLKQSTPWTVAKSYGIGDSTANVILGTIDRVGKKASAPKSASEVLKSTLTDMVTKAGNKSR